MTSSLEHSVDPWLQNMCNAAVTNLYLNRCVIDLQYIGILCATNFILPTCFGISYSATLLFTPTQYMQYVYLDFNLNVPIPWRCITCLVVLTRNPISKYANAVRVRCKNLSNNNFCKNEMTGSIVALFVEC